MRAFQARLTEYMRQWRVARAQRRAGRDAAHDQAAADELQQAREGINRFPPGAGAGGGV
jgi:hypothetical protein